MKIKHGSLLIGKLIFGLVLCLGSVSQDFTESIKSGSQSSSNRFWPSGLSFGLNSAHSSGHYVERISVTGYQLAYSTAFQPTLDHLYNIGFFDLILAGVVSTNSNGESEVRYNANATDDHMDHEDIQDGATLAVELKNRLNQMFSEAGLTTEMKQRIRSDIIKLDRFISKSSIYLSLVNSGSQAIAHAARAEYLAAAAEVTGLLTGLLVSFGATAIAGTVGAPLWLAGAFGAILGYYAANGAEQWSQKVFEALSRHHNVNPYNFLTPQWYNWQSFICGLAVPADFCNVYRNR